MEGSDQTALAAQQVDAVWSMMLAQMTEAGATREDIVSVTVQTAQAIIATTTDNLWPNAEVPPGEEPAASLLRDIRFALETYQADQPR